jgi:mono/diheme cytochrome c family protein
MAILVRACPWLVAFAVGLCAVGAVRSGDCVAPVVVKQQVYGQHYQQVVVAQFVAIPVAVPLYAVGYDPHSYGVTEELKAIREELRQAREGVAPQSHRADPNEPQVLPQKSPDAVTAILTQHCASCHTGAKSKGGLVIFAGPGVLDAHADLFQLWDAAESKTMPPNPRPKVPQADLDALRAALRKSAHK